MTLRAPTVCKYGNCDEPVLADGVAVTLYRPTEDDTHRAHFCCAAHAAGALQRLALDRGEELRELPPVPKFYYFKKPR